MTGQRFDVWLHALPDTPPGSAARAIARRFGVEIALAQQLATALPCHVRQGVALEEARRFAGALAEIGGRVEVCPSGARPATPTGTVADTGATLKVGTFEDPALPVPPHAVSPAPPSTGSPAPRPHPPLAAAEVPTPTPPPRDAPDTSVGLLSVSDQVPAPIALQEGAATAWHDSLRLPISDAPAPVPMRSPASRARLPRAGGKASSATRAKDGVDPLKVTVDILREAQAGSLQHALRGHPIAGFVLVLGGTLLAFLALYAMT